MENDELIRVEVICSSYNVEPSFMDALFESGLIEVTMIEDTRFVDLSKMNDLEKMIRLHYDLDINLEGIETISHLLDRMYRLQDEINLMRNRLRFFEEAFAPDRGFDE